ncbi:ribonuclease Z [Pullulanibacillus camelliae]|uniref:Ribonuclease Z n=1 Tax=Pullulanibacillus camelliae TaxID=1707096 RepID=A0A8J2YCQ7_9BACL|nr:ribonuclease Z [Pullulanibacillus camelliae]GGE37867.1 ribonuclease Z [Pullulanibacillus camelliae]
MEFVFLGTGAGVPAKQRNVSSIALIMPEYKGDIWLFDCGEATQHQILHTKVKLSRVQKIFITHLHGDHIFGLPGLLGSRSFQGGIGPLEVYGPKGIAEFIERNLAISETHLTYPIKIQEIDEGIIYEDDTFRVVCGRLEHVIPSLGYRIEEKDKPGELLVDKIKEQLNLTPGPIYKKFKEHEWLHLQDGREVRTADYLGPTKRGRIITVLGDTRPCIGAIRLAEQADVLVHESTFLKDKAEGANAFGHSTAEQAALTAKNAYVKTLLLTHISSRYQESADALLSEARELFQPCYLAHDLWSYDID